MLRKQDDTDAWIQINYDHGGPTYYIKENPCTLGERVAYVRTVDLGMSRRQLAAHAGLCERTLIRIEQDKATRLLLPSALAIAEALGVSLDWLCGRIDESGDNID